MVAPGGERNNTRSFKIPQAHLGSKARNWLNYYRSVHASKTRLCAPAACFTAQLGDVAAVLPASPQSWQQSLEV